jgi:hypothetical protein
MPEPVVELVGVYAADGGLVGEVAYVVGHLLGRTECALCDVTHGTLRRKPDWDAMTARLPVPLRLVHRNETTTAERTASERSGLPVVLGVRPDGSHTVVSVRPGSRGWAAPSSGSRRPCARHTRRRVSRVSGPTWATVDRLAARPPEVAR